MRRIFGPLALALLLTPALAADNTLLVTPCASGCITPRSKDVGSGVQSMIQILGDTSGNAIYGTAGTANANILSVQGIASMTPLLATVTGSLTNISGTISLPTLASTSTKQSDGSQKSQIVDGSGNVIGATSNALDVNIKSGAGSGGTAIADEAAFTQGTTSLTPIGCLYATSITNLTAGQAGVVRCTNDRTLQVTVANTNANGQATMANSSPVVIASNQSNLPTNTAQVNGVTVLTGTGATGTGAQRVTVSTDQATNAGAALVKGGVGVVNGGSRYQAVAASQTATVLQSSSGATGDYLSHCVIYPASTSPGVVTVFDGTNTAANSAILFAGGATSTSNLTPISVPVGALSRNGSWQVTTGANVSVVCYGTFS